MPRASLCAKRGMLVNRAQIELALGRSAQALATIESALPALANGDVTIKAIEANANLTHGRALLAVDRAPQALEPLRQAYGYWLAHEPHSEWAAEAEHWFAQAYLATGDTKRGRWMEAGGAAHTGSIIVQAAPHACRPIDRIAAINHT